MPTKEQSIKTAFILSIIGAASSDLFLLTYIFLYRIGNIFIVNDLMSFVLSPVLAAPLVLGILSLTMVRDIGGVSGKDRILYIFTRVLSIIAIVEGAILGTCVLVYLTIRFVSNIVFGVLGCNPFFVVGAILSIILICQQEEKEEVQAEPKQEEAPIEEKEGE